MAKVSTQNNTRLNSGVITATFTDFDDHVFSKFRINPADLKTAERAMEYAGYFENLNFDPEDLTKTAELQKEIEDKISYILGYNSSADIFGEVSALTILPDGSLFVEHVVNKLMEIVEPAVTQRKKAMQKRAEKYTAKYEVNESV